MRHFLVRFFGFTGLLAMTPYFLCAPRSWGDTFQPLRR
jgi:hypothetical protein